MKIVYLAADNDNEWNCSEWRCAIPVRAWQRSGLADAQLHRLPAFLAGNPDARQAVAAADVVVLERMLVGPMPWHVQQWRAQGKAVVLDFDDAYHLMQPDNRAFPFWHEGFVRQPGGAMTRLKTLPIHEFKDYMFSVSAITTPSRLLCADYSELTNAARYLPNYLDWQRYERVGLQPHEGIVIGWGGSMSHYNSWNGSGLAQALRRVCRLRADVRVAVNGADPRIPDMLHSIRDRLIVRPWVLCGDWPREIAAWDIGLAPLHGAYDDRRSWIKPLEYSAVGIPWIATDSPAYLDIAPQGVTVRNGAANWERAILHMIDNLPAYQMQAERAREWAREQAIDRHLTEIRAMYQELAYERA